MSSRPPRRRARAAARSGSGRSTKGVTRALEVAAAIVVLGAIAALAWLFLLYPDRAENEGRHGADLALVVSAEDDIDDVARELARLGAIDHATLFATYARLLGADHHLRRGVVHLRAGMRVRTLLSRVAEGYGESSIVILVPEGFDRHAVASRLARWDVCDADAFLAATGDRALLDELEIPGPTAEGYLFPETYTFVTGSDPHEVLRRFVRAYRTHTRALFEEGAEDAPRRRLARLGMGPHEILTLASIVEEEAVVREEQPIIAGVFVNRLESESFLPRRRLQADPTVAYGCREEPARPSCHGFDGRRITRAMLDDAENPYNTYRRSGLPPGPISNPGLDAIRAVLHHGEHGYFYFVARGGGRHAFSERLDDHNRGVSELRERERRSGPGGASGGAGVVGQGR